MEEWNANRSGRLKRILGSRRSLLIEEYLREEQLEEILGSRGEATRQESEEAHTFSLEAAGTYTSI